MKILLPVDGSKYSPHTGAKSALLGSTATSVVHLSDLPVTLVK